MRRAFTLLELLVVIGIMGMLATVSIGGYSALTRGMAERGALDAAAGLLNVALQRAQVDRTSVYLFVYDDVQSLEDDENVGTVSGVLIAVRPTGRVTHRIGDLIVDEFGDLNKSYSSLDAADKNESESEVEDRAGLTKLYNLSASPPQVGTIYEGVFACPQVDESDLEDTEGKVNVLKYGFKLKGDATFSVGDQYGQEFAAVRMPPGFVFGSTVQMTSSSDLGLKQIGQPREIRPDDTSLLNLTVRRVQPDGSLKDIGSTSDIKDMNR